MSTLKSGLSDFMRIAEEIEARSAALRTENVKVRVQLADALDAIHELKSQIVTKDNIIAELQELRAREGNR